MQLKELRKARGLSLKELGDILGVAESTVSLYENSKREASYTVLQKLSKYFNVSIDYLLGGDKQNGEQKCPYTIYIPILESVSLSGGGVECNYSAEKESIELGSTDDFFYFKMHGESMAPQIAGGDIALIKKQDDAESGSIAAVIYGDNPVMLRRIVKNGEITVLHPFNPNFESFFVNRGEKITILGVVTETIKKW